MDYMQRMAVPGAQDPIQRQEPPYFEDVSVGYEVHLTKPPITRLQIAKFAGASGDFNPSNVDEDIAREIGGMGGVFAHGMIGMGFIGQMLTDWVGAQLCHQYIKGDWGRRSASAVDGNSYLSRRGTIRLARRTCTPSPFWLCSDLIGCDTDPAGGVELALDQ
jgi:hypothetical protein